jgi:hypothetical protein
MRESELLEGNRFVRGIKKIHDRLFAMVRLYDQLTPAHVTLAVALSLDLSRHRKASLIPLSRLWEPAAIEWPSFTQRCMALTVRDVSFAPIGKGDHKNSGHRHPHTTSVFGAPQHSIDGAHNGGGCYRPDNCCRRQPTFAAE